MPLKSQPLTPCVTVWDTQNNAGATGDAANLTIMVVCDGVLVARNSTAAITEVSAALCPGVYAVPLNATDMAANTVSVAGSSTTPGNAVLPTHIVTERERLQAVKAALDHVDLAT